MVSPNKIWDKVRENLKKAIDNVNDENTELFVIPFAFDNQYHPNGLTAYIENATPTGKATLKNVIDNLPMSRNTMTYHSDPLKDFYYNNRVNTNRITYLFFMTDGQNEENPDLFTPLLKQWEKRYGNKHVYGFYVMLSDLAKDDNIEKIIKEQEHLWGVETADVNINLIRLDDKAIYNVRNDQYIELNIWGIHKGLEFCCTFPSDSPYKVEKCNVGNGKLRIYVSHKEDIHSLPIASTYTMMLEINNKGNYDFLVTKEVMVKCENKPERSLKVSVR